MGWQWGALGLEPEYLKIAVECTLPGLSLTSSVMRTGHPLVGRVSEIALGSLTTIVIPALLTPYRLQKLWICMEFCGAGSLQDIYQG